MENPNSHLTAKTRESISFPARLLLEKKLLNGNILDYGCGFGKDVEILSNKGFDVTGYDPFYCKDYPTAQFDTILCIYVLNVLTPQSQAEVLFKISNLLKAGGKAYFAVRRDIQFEGFRMHKLHQKNTYQCNVILPFKSFFKNDSVEIYEYQHYSYLHRDTENISPFFADGEVKTQVGEIATAFAILDKFPVSPGHTLIIPKRKVSNYFDLNFKEQSACWYMVNLIRKSLEERETPSGFNIGVNIKEAAGQTVPHCHIHLIPRYEGDVKNPRGGVRGVIPKKKDY